MARAAHGLPSVPVELAFALLLVAASGGAAVLQGQDANIDLYRYRLYIGYAFVNGGRLDQDLVPASLGTYLCPVLDAFHYLGIVHLPPRVFSFLLGSLQGLNAVLVLLLARRVLPAEPGSRLLAILAATLAAVGPTARSLLGTTLGDTLASLPALAALLLAVPAQPPAALRRTALSLFMAGGLAGAAVALKLTMTSAAVGVGFLVATHLLRRRIPPTSALGALAGAAIGYLAVAGYWGWQLWSRFENPMFPFLNQIFRSPYLPAEALRDTRWAAHSFRDFLSPPFDIALGMTERLQEIPFRDARFLALFLVALAWLGLRLAGRRAPLPAAERSVLDYALASYIFWALAFYYYRYAAVLEFVAPLALLLLIRRVALALARPFAISVTALVLVTSSVGSWGRLDFGDRWLNVRLPKQAYEPASLVLVDSPLSSFLIPYFPATTSFAGLEPVGSRRFEELVTARIAAHRGNLFWLVSRGRPAESTGPERFGLPVSDDCGIIRTGEGRWALCRLVAPAGPRS